MCHTGEADGVPQALQDGKPVEDDGVDGETGVELPIGCGLCADISDVPRQNCGEHEPSKPRARARCPPSRQHRPGRDLE